MTLADFKVPGSGLDGLYYLRDVVDADKMYAHIMKSSETGKKVCSTHAALPAVGAREWVRGNS